ncbi:hypothetical protein [Microbacterium sp. A84]|uniref:hypothetical protein n=1 Tax=Microbacterium sp. A84 TaxID=3450715 RepID=UPI003F437BBB
MTHSGSGAPVWWCETAPTWRAGGWTIALRGDELADIRSGDVVILRAVRAVVRDAGWNTVPVSVIDANLGAESLVLQLRHEGLGAAVTSRLTVDLQGDALRIDWDAENLRDFDTCRVGLVVLHPPSDAGRAVTATHSDGSLERTALPDAISPHQPIMDICALQVGDGDAATMLRFDGDVFEMEDQRNWSDASFKTYSRPLALPYPYALRAGERVHQVITLDAPLLPPAAQKRRAEISLVEGGAFPLVGVEASTAPDGPNPQPSSPVGDFRIVELNLTTPTWRAALARAAADGLHLDVRLVTDADPAPLAEAARALADHRVIAITAFDSILHVSECSAVEGLRTALSAAGLAIPIRGGARSHFTELNREHRRIPDDVEGITITTTPLFHSLDTEQLVEALAMQRLIATQTVEMAAGLPVHIGPVTLRPRFNNVATTPQSAPTLTDLSQGYGAQFTGADDERQDARELAAWTIASAAALAVPGVASLAWFETWGPRGLRDASGMPRPVADAITKVAALAGRTLLWGGSPDGLLWAIGARGEDGDIILVANLDRTSRPLRLTGADTSPLEVNVGAGEWLRLHRAHSSTRLSRQWTGAPRVPDGTARDARSHHPDPRSI